MFNTNQNSDMKASLIKKSVQHTRFNLLSILKISLIGLLFPIKIMAVGQVIIGGVVITAASIAAFCAGATLLITVWDHTVGCFYEVEQTKWRYDRSIRTVYRGVEILQSWAAVQPNAAGNWNYYYRCQSESFSDKTTYSHRDEFSIAEYGSMGDVPLEVRDSRCEYWVEDDYSEPNRMTQRLFSYSNQTEFQVRCKLSYKNSPWFVPQEKHVTLTLLNWTPELNNCEEASRYRSTSASFNGTIPANGTGNIAVKSRWLNGSMINLSHGEGAGIAVK